MTPFELTFKDAWTILPAWNAMAPVMQPENFYTDRKEGKTTFEGTHEAVLENYLKLVPYAQKDYMGTSYAVSYTHLCLLVIAIMIQRKCRCVIPLAMV